MAVYAIAIFTSAFLLFQVQPLIGKYLLPWFGGTPAVWTLCLLFFQVLLLGGYAYAYLISRWLKPRSQIVCHLVLVGVALALLPVTPGDHWKPNGNGNPTLRIFEILLANVGVQYFILSATSPLIQHWFNISYPSSRVYRLYALSNTGSLLALLSFPVYFEPGFTRHGLAVIWSWAFVGYAVACCFFSVKVWCAGNQTRIPDRPQKPALANSNRAGTEGAKGFTLRHLLWLLLPGCASMLLLATTNKMCQEVAVIPFLWILPLSLYLLSFIICFDNPRWYVRPLFITLLGVSWAAWLIFLSPTTPIKLQLAVYSAGFFICCMVCHGELYRLKPEPGYLTFFYLMIAAGGALGSSVVAILAPLVFKDYLELQIGIIFSGVLLLLICVEQWRRIKRARSILMTAACLNIVVFSLLIWKEHDSSKQVQKTRNFYGVLSLYDGSRKGSGDQLLFLQHGATVHGTQFSDPVRAKLATLYYGEKSGVGLAMHALEDRDRNIGLIGLGAGTLAAYGKRGDHFYVYEINPEIIHLARSRFSYLSNCPGKVEIEPGDARLSLESSSPRNFDLLVLDAFSGDAIPVHLLTREAFAVYSRHMKTNGIIAVHITNRSLNLEPVIVNVARNLNYNFAVIDQAPPSDQWWIADNTWVLLTHDEEILKLPPIRVAARPAQTDSLDLRLWTDDFASLFGILRPKPPQADTKFEEAEFQAARIQGERGNYSGAADVFRLALKSHPDSFALQNNLAFLLATCPDVRVRNGAEAIVHAERACELTSYKQVIPVTTLAVAYSQAKRYDDAIWMAKKACALASDLNDQEQFRRNEELIESWRESENNLVTPGNQPK